MLSVQKRLAAQVLKCGKNRIRFDPEKLTEIKEAITKNDVKSLINNGVISKKRLLNTSRFWARKAKRQKSHGRRKGFGSRKGKKSARNNPKRSWINKIRLQRGYIRYLRGKNMITNEAHNELYMKSKGGYFRSLRHMKLYISEKNIMKK